LLAANSFRVLQAVLNFGYTVGTGQTRADEGFAASPWLSFWLGRLNWLEIFFSVVFIIFGGVIFSIRVRYWIGRVFGLLWLFWIYRFCRVAIIWRS